MADGNIDVVVVVPGVMGSALADADGREVWGLSPGGIWRALVTLGGSLRDLTLPATYGDGPAPDEVTPVGLIPGFHVIPGIWSPLHGYRKLLQFLAQPRFGLTPDISADQGSAPGNLICFPYDWRLSNRWTAQLLKQRVEPALERWRRSSPDRREARVVFVCHSMGGLVARWYAECGGGAEVTRSIITLGTPHRGALEALDQLVNGVRRGLGPLAFDLTRFARSLPSSYELMPAYACVEDGAGALRKTTEVDLPKLDRRRVAAGMSFHDELDAAGARPTTVPIVGIGQPTPTTARVDGERLRALDSIEGRDRGGDGTVPRLSGRPKHMTERDPAIRGVCDGHGALATHGSVLDQLDFALTAEDVVYRAALEVGPVDRELVGLGVPRLHIAGEPVTVTVRAPVRRVLEAVAFDEFGRRQGAELVRFRESAEGVHCVGQVSFARLGPGGYTLVVRAPDDPQGVFWPHVRATTLVAAA